MEYLLRKYDVIETSYHFYSDRIDLHFCDDPGGGRSDHPELAGGGAFQVFNTLHTEKSAALQLVFLDTGRQGSVGVFVYLRCLLPDYSLTTTLTTLQEERENTGCAILLTPLIGLGYRSVVDSDHQLNFAYISTFSEWPCSI